MAKPTVTITVDAKEAIEKLKEIREEIPREVDEATEAGALQIERDAALLCPVDTGRLRSSIKTSKIADGVYVVKAGGDSPTGEVDYAQYVEFGTIFMAPQPFMTPATIVNEPRINELINEAIRKTIV